MRTNRNFGNAAVLSALLAGATLSGAASAQTADTLDTADMANMAPATSVHIPNKGPASCRALRADAGWRGTGITVNPNQLVCVAADGLWSHGIQGIQAITPFYGPEGFAKDDPVNVPEVVARVGALIGRVGGNPPFVIGKQLCFIPSTAGQLMLSMNDDPGTFANNAGYLRVAIGSWPASTPPDRVHAQPLSCLAR